MSQNEVDTLSKPCGDHDGTTTGTSVRVTLIALLLAGCAASPAPESIRATYVSSIPYQSWSCDQLHQEQLSLATALANVTAQQEQIRSDERVQSAISMILPLPMSAAGAENVGPQVEIGHVKGEEEAVGQAMAHNGCPSQSVQQTATG